MSNTLFTLLVIAILTAAALVAAYCLMGWTMHQLPRLAP